MPKHWYMQFEPDKWLSAEEVRCCAPASRACWFDWLCHMHKKDRCGRLTKIVTEFAKMATCTPKEAAFALIELRRTNAADVGVSGVSGSSEITLNATVTLTNRRMRREYLVRKLSNLRVLRHRNGCLSDEQESLETELKRECSVYDSDSGSLEEPEKEKPPARPRAKNPLWDAVAAQWFGGNVAEPQAGRVGLIVKNLTALEATPDELRKRINRHKTEWPKAECSPESIVKNWARFDGRNGVARRPDRSVEHPVPAADQAAQVEPPLVPQEKLRSIRTVIEEVRKSA